MDFNCMALSITAWGLARDNIPGRETHPIMRRHYAGRRACLIITIARTFIWSEDPAQIEQGILTEFESHIDISACTDRERAIAHEVIASILADAHELADNPALLPDEEEDEDGCDPGGGPLPPDDRDLDDPW
jgi:hypothetical protein